MVGVEADYKFRYETVHIIENSTLYLYTDGVYEIKLPDKKGMKLEDLESLLSENTKIHTDDLDIIYDYMIGLNGGTILDDDFTLINIQIR